MKEKITFWKSFKKEVFMLADIVKRKSIIGAIWFIICLVFWGVLCTFGLPFVLGLIFYPFLGPMNTAILMMTGNFLGFWLWITWIRVNWLNAEEK